MSSYPIFLIGYMATGKTTFGRALARATGRRFIDLDFYIEQRWHSTVSGLFARHGEAAFRDMESAMLREVGEMDGVVVACGGGTPCFGSNMDYMLAHGVTVCLTASDERIVERMLRAGSRRPLVAGKSRSELLEYVASHRAGREPWYRRADIVWDGEHLEDVRQIGTSVDAFLKRYPPLARQGGDR